jgi:hypothetical protein
MSCICLYLKVMITRDLLNNSMQALPRNMEGNCTVFSSKSFDDKGCSFRVLLKTSWGKEKKILTRLPIDGGKLNFSDGKLLGHQCLSFSSYRLNWASGPLAPSLPKIASFLENLSEIGDIMKSAYQAARKAGIVFPSYWDIVCNFYINKNGTGFIVFYTEEECLLSITFAQSKVKSMNVTKYEGDEPSKRHYEDLFFSRTGKLTKIVSKQGSRIKKIRLYRREEIFVTISRYSNKYVNSITYYKNSKKQYKATFARSPEFSETLFCKGKEVHNPFIHVSIKESLPSTVLHLVNEAKLQWSEKKTN